MILWSYVIGLLLGSRTLGWHQKGSPWDQDNSKCFTNRSSCDSEFSAIECKYRMTAVRLTDMFQILLLEREKANIGYLSDDNSATFGIYMYTVYICVYCCSAGCRVTCTTGTSFKIIFLLANNSSHSAHNIFMLLIAVENCTKLSTHLRILCRHLVTNTT